MTHICVGNLTMIASDNGLSPGRRQANIWTNAGILLTRTLGTKLGEILSEIHKFSFKNMHLKTLSAKWWSVCFGLDVITENGAWRSNKHVVYVGCNYSFMSYLNRHVEVRTWVSNYSLHFFVDVTTYSSFEWNGGLTYSSLVTPYDGTKRLP